jgi:signal transduction histidine kinase
VEIAEMPDGRLAAPVEAAAYYVVAEAIANVGKYAHASYATVSISRTNGMTNVLVADDGVGGADPARGSGLRGLAARVEALNGHLDVDSTPGRGTRIRAEIPTPD